MKAKHPCLYIKAGLVTLWTMSLHLCPSASCSYISCLEAMLTPSMYTWLWGIKRQAKRSVSICRATLSADSGGYSSSYFKKVHLKVIFSFILVFWLSFLASSRKGLIYILYSFIYKKKSCLKCTSEINWYYKLKSSLFTPINNHPQKETF